MNHSITTKDAMALWALHAAPEGGHLSVERIYRLSEIKGLADATPEELRHLSQCPRCMDQWESLCHVQTRDRADDYLADEGGWTLGGGILNAAAGQGMAGPLQLTSDCQRFMLTILPEESQETCGLPQKAMLVLEILQNRDAFHGKLATVKDAGKMTVMASTVRHGRAAVKTDCLQRLNFSSWTIVLSDPSVLPGESPPKGNR